jgi:hypothetical protein
LAIFLKKKLPKREADQRPLSIAFTNYTSNNQVWYYNTTGATKDFRRTFKCLSPTISGLCDPTRMNEPSI